MACVRAWWRGDLWNGNETWRGGARACAGAFCVDGTSMSMSMGVYVGSDECEKDADTPYEPNGLRVQGASHACVVCSRGHSKKQRQVGLRGTRDALYSTPDAIRRRQLEAEVVRTHAHLPISPIKIATARWKSRKRECEHASNVSTSGVHGYK